MTLALVASACGGGGESGPTAPLPPAPAESAIAIASIAPAAAPTLVQDSNQRSHSQDFGSVYTFARP